MGRGRARHIDLSPTSFLAIPLNHPIDSLFPQSHVISQAGRSSKTLSNQIECGKVKLFSELQPLKAISSAQATDVGMLTLVSELQSWKAPALIRVTEQGIVKVVKELQALKVSCSIEVIELGIVKLEIELHL